jgi:hypothetical protein
VLTQLRPSEELKSRDEIPKASPITDYRRLSRQVIDCIENGMPESDSLFIKSTLNTGSRSTVAS